MDQTSSAPLDVIVAGFDTENGAKESLERLKEVQKEKLISIQNAAVLWKDDKGKLHFKETADMGGGKGAAVGGVIGGVVGLIFPPSILVGAAAGAAIGGLAAKLRDSGFPDERLRQVGEALKPNTSALIAVIEHVWVLQVEEELRQYGANLVTEAVRADIAAQLAAEAPVPVPVTSAGEAATAETAAGAETAETATTPPPPETSTGGTTTPA